MSLFGSIQLANNALHAQQIGLQVTGQNIANANTPGYIREEVVLAPAATQRQGNLVLGLGVQVKAVIQRIDQFLEKRLRGTISDLANSEAQEQTYLQLEGLMGELGDTDLSTSLNSFFASIHEVLNQPESVATRNLAVLQGQTLTGDISRLQSRVQDIRGGLDEQVVAAADDMNRLIEEIRQLNVRIAETENSDISGSDAVGLRDQRNLALANLAKLTDIRVAELTSGAVGVFSGGDFLVFEGEAHFVKVSQTSDRGMPISEIRLESTNAPLQSTGGLIGGLATSRDEIVGGFLDNLDSFAGALVFEFNKLYASGQGLKGYSSLTGSNFVTDQSAALDAAGLTFTPVNGSFQVQIHNKHTGLTQTTDVTVDLNGLNGDTSLTSLAAALDAISGISASITSGKLNIQCDSADLEFAFANDTSGALAALGVNTFFTGTKASDIGVNSDLVTDPALFAASRGGIGHDTAGAEDLAAFLDRPLDTQNGSSLGILYNRLSSAVTQGSSVTQAVANGFRVYQESLTGQQMAISGVNLDEEAVKMIQYQRAFQAAAKYIATLHELLGVLIEL